MFERSFEIGRILVMKGSRQILVKEVLFCLGGRGQLHNNATPSFSPDSKSSILGLSNEVSFVSRFLWKKGENWGKEKSMIWPNVSNWRTVYVLNYFTNENILARAGIVVPFFIPTMTNCNTVFISSAIAVWFTWIPIRWGNFCSTICEHKRGLTLE